MKKKIEQFQHFNKSKIEDLRKKALQISKQKNITPEFEVWKDDISKLLEELSIHQIELEMQNEELLLAQNYIANEKRKYKDLYDFAPIAYITLNDTGNIIQLNFAAARLFGKTRESFHLNSIFPFLTDESKNEFRIMMKNAFEFGNQNGELIFLNVKKEPIYTKVELKSYFEKELNNKLCWANITDITRQKQIEKELQELNITKDKFFSIISHDLKGPIGSIINILGFLQKSPNDVDQKKSLDLIHQTTKQTYNLLEDLLLWSRAQTKRIEFRPQFFKIKYLIEEVVSFQKNVSANKKNIEINADQIREDTIVYGDSEMVKTIFRNLLSNAIKFTKSNGKVIIDSKPLANDKILFSIADTGIGISSENQNKLFNLGENFSTYGTEHEKGTGLGLILCKELVEKNGGNIFMESTLGKGSKFSFTLNLKPF